MGKTILTLGMVLGVVILVVALVRGPITREERQIQAQAEATRLAVQNERAQIENARAEVELRVNQGAASARIAALQTWYMGLAIAGVLIVLLLALVIPLWMYNRASMAYPRHGLYPIVVRPGIRGTTVLDANRLPGPNLQVTSQAQAVQLAASLARDDMTPHERSVTMQEISRAFQPALLDPPIERSGLTISHVERLLLEDGQDGDDA